MCRCFRATQTARARADERETSKCKTDVLQNSHFSSLCRTIPPSSSSSRLLFSVICPYFSLSLSGRGLISEIGQDIFWPISLTFRSVGLQRGSVPARKKHKTHKSKNLGERLGALGQREATSALPLYSIAGTSHFEDLPLTATAKLPTSNHTTSP